MGPSWVLGAESTRLTNTRMVILSSLQARMKHPFYRLLTFPRGCHLSFKVLASLMLPHSCLAIGKASKPPVVPRLSSPPVSSPRAVTSSRGRLLSPPHPPALTPLRPSSPPPLRELYLCAKCHSLLRLARAFHDLRPFKLFTWPQTPCPHPSLLSGLQASSLLRPLQFTRAVLSS